MIKPFVAERLFKPNYSWEMETHENYIVIDNFFEDFDSIYDYMYNSHHENWKIGSNERNFIDYYDCRTVINNTWPDQELIDKRMEYYFQLGKFCAPDIPVSIQRTFSFNIWSIVTPEVSKDLQVIPHKERALNMVVYLDKISSGGTALYYETDEKMMQHMKDAGDGDLETYNLMDISGLNFEVLQSKPNRCVIFDGNIWHGMYVEDHDKYRDEWLYNYCHFLEYA